MNRAYKCSTQAKVIIELKLGMLDPEAITAKRALGHLGYDISSLRPQSY